MCQIRPKKRCFPGLPYKKMESNLEVIIGNVLDYDNQCHMRSFSMTILSIILTVLSAISILLLTWIISTYNQFIRLSNMLKEAWSGIDVQLKRRWDLIPNLVETVKGYSIHEKSVFEQVTKARAQSISAQGIDEKSRAEAGLSGALKTLFAVAESYPELKANENFIALQKELSTIEDEIQLSRRYYNGTVRNYTIMRTAFPSNIIANMAHFGPEPYFELSIEDERKNPHVKF